MDDPDKLDQKPVMQLILHLQMKNLKTQEIKWFVYVAMRGDKSRTRELD